MQKSLDQKLSRLAASSSCDEFILADAKDADMAFGLTAPGVNSNGALRSIDEYRDQIRQIVAQGLVDIALMSASTAEVLAGDERLFETSAVTAAVRANDTTDIWLAAGSGDYSDQPALPFHTAKVDRIMYPAGPAATPAVQLGLFSITLNNLAAEDRAMLQAYGAFRCNAEKVGFQHFLEVFPPNLKGDNLPRDVGQFVADSVVRLLAGLTRAERPLFLKIPYLGPALTEKLVTYDASMIVGIMGGPAGTTLDAFALLADAKKHGVRAALFGRHINRSEDQLAFVKHLRWIANGEIAAQEAVRSYHAELTKAGIAPARPLFDDLQCTNGNLASYIAPAQTIAL